MSGPRVVTSPELWATAVEKVKVMRYPFVAVVMDGLGRFSSAGGIVVRDWETVI